MRVSHLRTRRRSTSMHRTWTCHRRRGAAKRREEERREEDRRGERVSRRDIERGLEPLTRTLAPICVMRSRFFFPFFFIRVLIQIAYADADSKNASHRKVGASRATCERIKKRKWGATNAIAIHR